VSALQQQLPRPNHLLLEEIRNKANQFSASLEFTLAPSHVGKPGNEKVDQLAANSLKSSVVHIELLPEIQEDYKKSGHIYMKKKRAVAHRRKCYN
jgi:ribonuclease HI